MKLTDILPVEKWMEFEDKIFKKSGLESNVFNILGIRITNNKRWVNRLCPEIKANDKGQSFICAVAHMNLAAQANKTKKHVIFECDAGLLKIVVPIFVKDEFVGAIGACGLLLDDGEVDSFMIEKTTEIDEEKIKSLSNDISKVSTHFAESLVEFIKEELDLILRKFDQ